MKQVVSRTLLDTMQDDPWFNPDIFDSRGLHVGFQPTTDDTDDPFTPPPEKKMLTYEQRQRIAERDPEIVQEAIQDLAANPGHYGFRKISPAEVSELQKRLDPDKKTSFYSDGWKIDMLWNGKWTCLGVNQETGERKRFTLGGTSKEDRDGAMTQASRYLATFNPPWQELTEEQLIVVSRIASGGNLPAMESAVMTYLNFAVPGIDRDISMEKSYQPLCDSICWYVFRHAHIDIDSKAEDWMRDRLGDRAVTINSLCGVYELWQNERNKRNRGLLFNPPEPEPETSESVQEGLDNLSDDALADLRQRTLKLAARR